MVRTLALAGLLAVVSMPAQAQTCTRDALKAMVGNYFRAVETHSMSALPTAANLRITENGHEIKAGEGFFKTGGKVQFQRHLIDTERCGTLTQAVIDETVNGATAPIILAVRLKVNAGRVSEIETIVNRASEKPFFSPEGYLATRGQDWETLLPPAQRRTREYMNQQANKYFDGFAADPKDLPDFATPCHRWEGGLHTTAKNGDCSPKGLVLTHTFRRFPVSDLEAGITAGFINFNQTLPDVHIFKIRNGKVELIHAVIGGKQKGEIWPADSK